MHDSIRSFGMDKMHDSPSKMARFSASKMVIWLFLLKMAAIAGAVQVHAQPSQAGFLSIDCGSNSSYADKVTNISYVSDKGYVGTGSSYHIHGHHKTSKLPSQLLNLRSFPTGDRNCYTLAPVVPSRRYLVRAMFMYGNYDGKNKGASAVSPLQFDMHLGVNLWAKMNITDAASIYTLEALAMATTTSMSICLINTGNGDPFISALELRPFKETMYNLSQSDLALLARVNMGPLTSETLRYPKDPYDRFWEPFNVTTWTTIATNSTVNITGSDEFEAPSAVLQTAATPSNGSMALGFYFVADSESEEFYHILHFAEVQVLPVNSTRVFDIYRNGDLRMGNFSPTYLSSGYVYSAVPFSNYTRYDYWLNATANSTLLPLINGLEVYSVIPVTAVPTDSDDVHAINAIKEEYDLVKRNWNWVGDPCSPRDYSWDGLNCTYGSTSSRITKLNLSSKGLSGLISSSFAELRELTYLDLSNNSFTGEIPDNLGKMQSLQTLVLPCNYSTAPIPASLLQKSNDGQVTLRYNDGADACERSLVTSSSPSSPPSSSRTSTIHKPTFVALSIVLTLILIGTNEDILRLQFMSS